MNTAKYFVLVQSKKGPGLGNKAVSLPNDVSDLLKQYGSRGLKLNTVRTKGAYDYAIDVDAPDDLDLNSVLQDLKSKQSVKSLSAFAANAQQTNSGSVPM